MRLLSIEGGGCGHIVPVDEMVPREALNLPEVLDAIGKRYQFAVLPNLAAGATANQKGGLQFTAGVSASRTGRINIQKLSIHNDGIVVDCLDTHKSEAVIDDLLPWVTEKFSLRTPITKPHRWYASRVVVQFSRSADAVFSLVSALGGEIAAAVQNLYGLDIKYSASRFSMKADPTTVPPLRATEFIFERRIDRPYSENRYFSVAPVHTDMHLGFLEEIEKLATK